MQKLVITGGVALEGEIKASGAKNAALPLLACALLTDEPMTFVNVPDLADVHTMLKLLEELGCKVTQEGHKVTIDASHITSTEAPYDLVKTMRASILVLGPLLARFGKAKVSLPGGCSIGARPVDQHIKGLKALGADISIEHGYVTAHADKLVGTNIVTDMVTVTGTENLLMAAVLAEGTTVLANAAREPEVADLANCLVKMGAKIKGIGSPQMEIEGVKKLHGTTYRVISDRIEVGSFLVAAVMTKGKIRVTDCDPHTLTAVLEKLEEAGAKVTTGEDWIEVDGTGEHQAVDIRTAPYPGFPTDMQSQIAVCLSLADGTSLVTEKIFENRFKYTDELTKMGANIKVEGNTAFITGVDKYTGAVVVAPDLRAGAALVIAGLAAEGCTCVEQIQYIQRGYENFEEKIRSLGGIIERVDVEDRTDRDRMMRKMSLAAY